MFGSLLLWCYCDSEAALALSAIVWHCSPYVVLDGYDYEEGFDSLKPIILSAIDMSDTV